MKAIEIINQIKRIGLHLRLWRWAAVNRKDFNEFEIGVTKTIRIVPTLCPYGPAVFHLDIWILKPQFYLFEPGYATCEFCRTNGIDFGFMYPEDVFYHPNCYPNDIRF